MTRLSVTAASVLSLAALAACSDAPADPSASAAPTPLAVRAPADAVVPGEVLVKMKDGTSAQAMAAMGLRLNRMGFKDRFAVVTVERGREFEVAARLAAQPDVEYAEPNYLRQPHAINPKLWHFYNPGGLRGSFSDGSGFLPTTYSSVRDADIDNVESFGAGGAAVVIGSIDSGVDMDHPEFTGRLVAGRDWYNNDTNPEDDDGHGTHTTGTMAGSTVGVAGVSGAASNVRVLVQKVCGPPGCPTSAIVNAIYAAADYPGMVAVNVSIGGGRLSTGEKNAIAYATGKNVLVVASAGNAGTSRVECPACDANAISVSATNWRDGLAYYSSYGKGLDVTAPGGELYTDTDEVMGIYSAWPGGGYAYLQGTSMSTPQVTGALGVVASKTGLRGAALRSRVLGTTDDIGTAGYDTKFGSGRLNTYRAVTNSSLGTGL